MSSVPVRKNQGHGNREKYGALGGKEQLIIILNKDYVHWMISLMLN